MSCVRKHFHSDPLLTTSFVQKHFHSGPSLTMSCEPADSYLQCPLGMLIGDFIGPPNMFIGQFYRHSMSTWHVEKLLYLVT